VLTFFYFFETKSIYLGVCKGFRVGRFDITEYELLSLYFEKKYQEFKSFRDSQILILDEMGKRVLTEWQRIQLEELLSSRYNDMLPTIYITNLEEIGFREFLGARLADRLRENRIKRFAFNGGSLR
jgi:DNA replication protein DnaC